MLAAIAKLKQYESVKRVCTIRYDIKQHPNSKIQVAKFECTRNQPPTTQHLRAFDQHLHHLPHNAIFNTEFQELYIRKQW